METSDISDSAPKTIEQQLQQLVLANRARDEFLGKLTHELGNLFLPYQFALQLLGHAAADPSVVDQVRAMLEEHGRNVQQFMDDVRLVSRLVRGKIRPKLQMVDLCQVVQRSLAKATAAVDKGELSLSTDLPSEPLRLEGDPVLLETMLDHLLRNAIQFTPAGGRIWVRLVPESDRHELRVRDSGVGIPEDFLPRLFLPFAQADPSNSGWGAGLTIVRGVAQLHGGHVKLVRPEAGRGSEFVVTFPAPRQ